MSLNSFPFFVFLGVVLLVYYVLPPRVRNLALLGASLVFYGVWEWRLAGLLLWQIILCYGLGIAISRHPDRAIQRRILWLGALLSLGLLGFFKYFNFFNDSFRAFFLWLNLPYLIPHLDILLPLGISFFTFQSFGYLMDVYQGTVTVEHDFIAFALFVAFFPQISSGPIGRAPELLPQLKAWRPFDPEKFEAGLAQILWGIFKKSVIADRLAYYVDMVFANPGGYGSATLLLAAVFFSIQIYCDFSGYSDVAVGSARLFGIDLRQNFNFPYFATSIREFWQRWHISLTSWFRDYLYIPLGGNRCSKLRQKLNVLIVFFISGLWHGASWTFVLWGGLHGVLQLLENSLSRRQRRTLLSSSLLGRLVAGVATFTLVTIAWIFFRAPNLAIAVGMLAGLFHWHGGLVFGVSLNTFLLNMLLLVLFFVWEGWNYRHQEARRGAIVVSGVKYGVLLALIAMFGQTSNSFIYLQF